MVLVPSPTASCALTPTSDISEECAPGSGFSFGTCSVLFTGWDTSPRSYASNVSHRKSRKCTSPQPWFGVIFKKGKVQIKQRAIKTAARFKNKFPDSLEDIYTSKGNKGIQTGRTGPRVLCSPGYTGMQTDGREGREVLSGKI